MFIENYMKMSKIEIDNFENFGDQKISNWIFNETTLCACVCPGSLPGVLVSVCLCFHIMLFPIEFRKNRCYIASG